MVTRTKKQYQGYVNAKSGFLLGGGKVHRSIWFETKTDAMSWVRVIKKGNRDANRDVGTSGVVSRLAKKVWY